MFKSKSISGLSLMSGFSMVELLIVSSVVLTIALGLANVVADTSRQNGLLQRQLDMLQITNFTTQQLIATPGNFNCLATFYRGNQPIRINTVTNASIELTEIKRAFPPVGSSSLTEADVKGGRAQTLAIVRTATSTLNDGLLVERIRLILQDNDPSTLEPRLVITSLSQNNSMRLKPQEVLLGQFQLNTTVPAESFVESCSSAVVASLSDSDVQQTLRDSVETVTGRGIATCPTGKRLVGGGATCGTGGSIATSTTVTQSFPRANSWVAECSLAINYGGGSSTVIPSVYAICL